MSINDLVILRGRVGGDPIFHDGESGKNRSFVRFRVAGSRSRRKDNGEWDNSDSEWFTVKAWGILAENCRLSLRRGEPVIVVGRPTAQAWVGGDGELRSELAIHAHAIGHDLNLGSSIYRKYMFNRTVREEASKDHAAVGDTPASDVKPELVSAGAGEAGSDAVPAVAAEVGSDAVSAVAAESVVSNATPSSRASQKSPSGGKGTAETKTGPVDPKAQAA